MTSFAFILGVVPLLVGHGAGAEMRRVLGIAVFSGMLGVTLFGIFLTPVFFYVIEGFIENPLFSSERMRRLGKVLWYLLGILTLGIPWMLALLGKVRRRPGPVVPRRRLAGTNGHVATSNGSVTRNGVCADSGEPDTNADPGYVMRK
jgi:multidrug efflux pump